MEWITQNWFWILIAIFFVFMHLGHGGHGGGCGGGHEGHRPSDKPGSDKPPQGGHQH